MNSDLTTIKQKPEDLLCDLLILSDGTVLAHNLTPVMAKALQVLNPVDEIMRQRSVSSPQVSVSNGVSPQAGSA